MNYFHLMKMQTPECADDYGSAEHRLVIQTRESEDLVLALLGTGMGPGVFRVDRIAVRVNEFWHIGLARPETDEADRNDYSVFLPRMIGSFRRLVEELVRSCEENGVESIEVSKLRELIESTVVRGDADVRFY